MPHSFESSRPEHQIREHGIPTGHGFQDQKYAKGMRSPIQGQFPSDGGLNSPETASNVPQVPDSVGSGPMNYGPGGR